MIINKSLVFESRFGYGYYFAISKNRISIMLNGKMFTIQNIDKLKYFQYNNYFRTMKVTIKIYEHN